MLRAELRVGADELDRGLIAGDEVSASCGSATAPSRSAVPRATFAPAALRDLIEIHDFIAADNPAAAHRLVARFEDKASMLAANPGVGRARDEIHAGYRSLTVGQYVIFCRVVADGIKVVQVMHGTRDPPRIFEEP